MTIHELVQRVKHLNQAESAKQVEKFVLELLGPYERGEVVYTIYKRKIRAKLESLK